MGTIRRPARTAAVTARRLEGKGRTSTPRARGRLVIGTACTWRRRSRPPRHVEEAGLTPDDGAPPAAVEPVRVDSRYGRAATRSPEERLGDLGAEELAGLLPVGAPPPPGPDDRGDGHPAEGAFGVEGDAERIPVERRPVGVAPAAQQPLLGWLAVVVVGWVAATPFTLQHPRTVQRIGYALVGPVQRLFQHVDATPGQYTEKDISPYFWHNGAYPRTPEYQELFDEGFASWRLKVHGLVENPVELSIDELRALPNHEQITQHFCIQGWSGVAKWGGVSMATILDLVRPTPEAEWLVFYSLGDGPDGGLYYDVHPIEQMRYQLTMLAYDMNDEPLSYGHGAPLRLRNEIQHGFKQVKWIGGIDVVADFSEVAGGYGGYNADHEFFGYRQSI